jgi:hypothetical protein
MQRVSLQEAFDTYGKPVSGFREVDNLKPERQSWVFHCVNGDAILRCVVVRNDSWDTPKWVDISVVKAK